MDGPQFFGKPVKTRTAYCYGNADVTAEKFIQPAGKTFGEENQLTADAGISKYCKNETINTE